MYEGATGGKDRAVQSAHLSALQADVSDPAISKAYDDVRDDKSETNWLLLDYASPKSDKLQLTATGTGVREPLPTSVKRRRTDFFLDEQGLTELKTHLKEDQASFAYVRVVRRDLNPIQEG